MSAETALGIPLVVQKVVQKLDKKDLLRCRLVGPKNLWNREACKLLQVGRADIQNVHALTKFNDAFQSSVDDISLMPSQFCINIDKIMQTNDDGDDDENEEEHSRVAYKGEMERFVQIAGDHVKDLELHVSVGSMDVGLAGFLQTLLFNCFPNLNKFSLHARYVDNDELDYQDSIASLKSRLDTCEGNFVANLKEIELFVYPSLTFDPSMMDEICDKFISFTTELFRNAVNLHSVLLELTFSDSLAELLMEQAIVKSVLFNLVSSNLRKILLYPQKTSEECVSALIQHSGLALGDIRIYQIDNDSVTEADLKRLLHRYSNSLQSLELDFREPSEISFPLDVPLKKLKWLSVDNFEGSIEWEMLPAIENVELVYRSLERIIPYVLSYPLNDNSSSLDIRWNSDSQTELIAKLAKDNDDDDQQYKLPNPSIVSIAKRSKKKLISFHLAQSRLHEQEEDTKLSGKFLSSLSSHPVHFPIRKLGIIIDTDYVLPSDFEKFLKRYNTTLQELNLEFRFPFDMKFPLQTSMNKLTDLTLNNFRGSVEWSKLSKLKRVKLNSRSLRAIIPSIMNSPEDCKVDSIECFRGERDAEEDEFTPLFTELAPTFLPQLTTLKMGEGCTAPLAVIFSSCTRLQHLELTGCLGVTDELLCGTGDWQPDVLPIVSDDDDNEQGEEDDFLMHAQYRNLVEVRRVFPYIGTLKDLKYLELDASDDENAFSDISVLCGIIECDKLETLNLQSPNVYYQRSQRILQHANLQSLSEININCDHVYLNTISYI